MSPIAPSTIAFLHTAPVHVATFDALVAELAEGIRAVHIVDESLLDDAQRNGLTDALRGRIAVRVRQAGAAANVVVCTCSTIGAAAEETGRADGMSVMRVDRPMAEEAVRLGAWIVVIAAVESTVRPTTDLLNAVAQKCGVALQLTTVLAREAWPLFERGELDAYAQAIATRIDAVEGPCDAIVLAQASMGHAAALSVTTIPVLSSPRLAVRAAAEVLAALSR